MPKVINREEKQQHVIQAAIPLFAQKGFYNTKMSDVAIAADIGKGSLYEYFDNKDDLFLTIFQMWFRFLEEEVTLIKEKETTPTDKLEEVMKHIFKTFESYNDTYCIYFDFWAEIVRKNHTKFEESYQGLKDVFVNILSEGVESGEFKLGTPTITANIIMGTIDGVLVQWLVNRQAFSIRKAGKGTISMVIKGLKE